MRYTTYYSFQHNIGGLNNAMNLGNDINNRVSAGKMLIKPSDDPAGASMAITQQSAIASITQYSTARLYAQNKVALEDQTLTSVSNILTGNLKSKIVAAGDQTYSDEDRQALAKELEGIRDNLLDLANTKDSRGNYIFSGYKTDTKPFDDSGAYAGGTTAIMQKVSDTTDIQVSHTGDEVFMSGTSDDLFGALDKAITALNTPISGSSDPDQAREDLQTALDGANNANNHVISNIGKIQAEVGVNLQQIDALNTSADTQMINLQSDYEQTVGSDPNTVITMVAKSQMAQFSLSASMMVFQTMQGMNLFNMIR